jgi:seryl-tRNA synthetase
MLDIQLMRNDLDAVIVRLKSRSAHDYFDVARFKELDARRKEIQTSTQALQAERNAISATPKRRKNKRKWMR